MVSLEELASVRIAIVLCNNDELKKEVLCSGGSEYDRNINRYDTYRDREANWKKILENKTTTILEKLGLKRELVEKVACYVISIGLKMLIWSKYHEMTLGLSYKHGMKILNSYFFSPLGIIDNEKIAEELMKDRSLETKQKYTLACLYGFTKLIPDLYKQMSKEEKEYHGQRNSYPEIVNFWSDYQMGEVDKLRGEKSLDADMLEKAIESGSKAAVEYCLEETSLSRKKDAVIDAALKTVQKATQINNFRDCMLFVKHHHAVHRIPIHYFIDILCFLLSKMTEEQKKEFLKKDIEASPRAPLHGSGVLICFLRWPYQNYFMKTANLMWEFLPEITYINMLLRICDKINFRPKTSEDKTYNYIKLLKEFWIQSPDHYKRYVFIEKKITHFNRPDKTLNFYKHKLIVKLFTLQSGRTDEDRMVFELILASTTAKEIERIISSKEGNGICISLIEGEQWEMLEEFLLISFPSKVELKEFKRKLCFTEEVQDVFAHFIKYKWDVAEFFIKWSSLSEEEIIRFKKEMICSDNGKNACWYLLLHKGGKIADRFCKWCFSSEEEITKFKKDLIFSVGVEYCADLIMEDKMEVIEEFIQWSHLSEEEIREFKEHFRYEKGNDICENLIVGVVKKRLSTTMWYMSDYIIQFQGGKWELVEKFLTWCFPSEAKRRDFKKGRLLNTSGLKIHFRLIELNQWVEAEHFFDWLGLSPEEVKQLKKETIFKHERIKRTLRLLMHRKRDHEELSDYESRKEKIELFFRWYLTDKETVLEFRDHFKKMYEVPEMSEKDKLFLRKFDSAINHRLSELDDEQGGLQV